MKNECKIWVVKEFVAVQYFVKYIDLLTMKRRYIVLNA